MIAAHIESCDLHTGEASFVIDNYRFGSMRAREPELMALPVERFYDVSYHLRVPPEGPEAIPPGYWSHL